MKFCTLAIPICSIAVLIFSCSDHPKTAPTPDSQPPSTAAPVVAPPVVEARTFEVKDSLGKALGWGYDLYVDGKRTIHQPTIPAIAGIHSFRTETDAQRVGELAAAKIRAGLGLPTISTQELDSMQIHP